MVVLEVAASYVPLIENVSKDVIHDKFKLKFGHAIFGRADGCDVQFNRMTMGAVMSRKHFEVKNEFIRDLGSKNGTYVRMDGKAQKIPAKEWIQLQKGFIIFIGEPKVSALWFRVLNV